MQTREQVIKGLECISGAVVWCAHCPYSSVDGSGRGERCKRDAAKDALALLKKQEPRVMTLEDVIMADFVWLEADDTIRTAIRTPGHPDYICFGVYFGAHVHDVIARKTNYGKTFRCWTSCPTDEQRKAVEWE